MQESRGLRSLASHVPAVPWLRLAITPRGTVSGQFSPTLRPPTAEPRPNDVSYPAALSPHVRLAAHTTTRGLSLPGPAVCTYSVRCTRKHYDCSRVASIHDPQHLKPWRSDPNRISPTGSAESRREKVTCSSSRESELPEIPRQLRGPGKAVLTRCYAAFFSWHCAAIPHSVAAKSAQEPSAPGGPGNRSATGPSQLQSSQAEAGREVLFQPLGSREYRARFGGGHPQAARTIVYSRAASWRRASFPEPPRLGRQTTGHSSHDGSGMAH